MLKKSSLIETIKKHKLERYIFAGNFGLEKENIRVDKDGKLAMTAHPDAFGNKLKNPYITVDFSESQVEMITPVCDSVESSYKFMENLHDIVSLELKDEYLWPQSLPAILPKDDEIPVAVYDDSERGKAARKYREHLAEKYGTKLQLMSGVHFNFSFAEDFIERLYDTMESQVEYKEFKNEIYLKTARNYLKYRWILIYLLGASSPAHVSYRDECLYKMIKLSEDSFYFEHSLSFRNGVCGYKNKDNLYVSHDSVDSYIKSIKELIENKKIDNIKEFYSSIRLKSKKCNDLLKELEEDGIEYVEIRTIDLNPFEKAGLNLKDLQFIHMFLLFCLFEDGSKLDEETYIMYEKNHCKAATAGKAEEVLFKRENGTMVTAKEKCEIVIKGIEGILKQMNLTTEKRDEILNFQREKLLDNNNLYIEKLINEVKEKGFINFHMERAKEYFKLSKNSSYSLKGFEDLELSTQILLKEAIKRGVKFDLLDRAENFVMLDNREKVEYIKQATKTSLDSYSTMLVMENKLVTKKVLEKANVKVPIGAYYTNMEDAKLDYDKYENKAIVIKPKSTNFGLGISIFTQKASKDDYNKAIEMAFSEDTSILIEEFISGNEYRFVVMGDEVSAILRRVPANITGNGKESIRELVAEKNKDPLRGKGYKTPLEKINLGKAEEMFLKNQNKDFDYVPAEGETVYLRENSNISTGGDSIDYTDDILQVYKDIAVKSAKAAGATICGVDMMLKDIKESNPEGNYAIIELNFNPAIHIHCYPYKGKNRELGKKVLDLLGY